MATYPTQHETLVAMIASVQRTRTELDLRETTTEVTPTEDARPLTSAAA